MWQKRSTYVRCNYTRTSKRFPNEQPPAYRYGRWFKCTSVGIYLVMISEQRIWNLPSWHSGDRSVRSSLTRSCYTTLTCPSPSWPCYWLFHKQFRKCRCRSSLWLYSLTLRQTVDSSFWTLYSATKSAILLMKHKKTRASLTLYPGYCGASYLLLAINLNWFKF